MQHQSTPKLPSLCVWLALCVALTCTALAQPKGGSETSKGSSTPAEVTEPSASSDEQSRAVRQADFEFDDAISVRVKSVQVYVRDKKGNPIKGLKAEDFVLLENGRPMSLTNFYEFEAGRRTDEADVPEMTQLERIQANPDEDPRFFSSVPEDRRLYLTIYVDHQNIRPQNRNRVFRDVRAFLRKHIGREDRVQLVTYARSVKVVREWTADASLISQGLFEEERHTGGRTSVDSDRRDIFEAIQDARSLSVLSSRARLFAEEQYNDAQFTLDGLRSVIDNVAGIPGRKALLYVSDGLPMMAGQEVFEAVLERADAGDLNGTGDTSGLRMQSFEYDISARLRSVTAAANANGVTFYTLDAAGLLGRSLRGADMRSTDLSSSIESTWSNNMQGPLMFLASDTGGEFAVNTNNFALALEKMNTDFRDYYSLGYAPPHPGTGREYRIKVQVKGKRGKGIGVIRYANSYRDKSPDKEMQEATLAGLQYGVENNKLGIRLKESQRIARSDGTFMVHIDVQIPLGKIAIIPRTEDVHIAKLQLWVQARDGEGDLSEPQREELPLTIPNADVETIGEKQYSYTMRLIMGAGDQWVSIGVRDALGGDTSVVTQTLKLGS